MRRVAVLVVLVTPLLAWADEKAVEAELKALSGTWLAVGGEAMGKAIAKEELPFTWTFKAGGKAVFADRKQKSESPFRYAIDVSGKPKTIDVTYDGPMANLKGARQFGIYKIEKGELTLCLSMPGAAEKDRPKGFSTKEGGAFLMRFKRAKGGE